MTKAEAFKGVSWDNEGSREGQQQIQIVSNC